MKSHIGLISVLTVLAAVLFLSVLISCNDRGAQLRQALDEYSGILYGADMEDKLFQYDMSGIL